MRFLRQIVLVDHPGSCLLTVIAVYDKVIAITVVCVMKRLPSWS